MCRSSTCFILHSFISYSINMFISSMESIFKHFLITPNLILIYSLSYAVWRVSLNLSSIKKSTSSLSRSTISYNLSSPTINCTSSSSNTYDFSNYYKYIYYLLLPFGQQVPTIQLLIIGYGLFDHI